MKENSQISLSRYQLFLLILSPFALISFILFQSHSYASINDSHSNVINPSKDFNVLLSQDNNEKLLSQIKSVHHKLSSMELKLSNVQKLAIEEKKLQATNKKFSDTKTPPKNSLTEKPSTVSKSDSKSQFFGLDHIYILNMDRRKDRLRTMQRIFNKLNANFTRIPAIDKKSPEFLEMYRNFKNAGGQLYAAGYAIKVSHLKVLKDMEKNGYETVMVMEDDIDLDLRIGTLLPLMLKKLPVDWGIYFVTYSKNVTPYPTHNSLIYPLGRFVSGALALVYRKSVLQKVQEYAKLDNKEPWDYMLGEMFVRDDWFGIKGYASDFVLAEHMGSTPNNPSDNLDTPDLTWKTSYDAEELLSSTFFSLEN